jgi:formate dehydrogenase major subunit
MNSKKSIVYIEGDPDHPINRGTLCPKGVSLKDDILSRGRVMVPKVRRPGSNRWEEISWDDAISGIARHIKTTRDKTFVARNAQGQVVNRNPGMGLVGGCTDTNEFNLLMWKAGASWGVVYRDSQARV